MTMTMAGWCQCQPWTPSMTDDSRSIQGRLGEVRVLSMSWLEDLFGFQLISDINGGDTSGGARVDDVDS